MDSNQGAAVARNNSIKNAIGKYIAFCDSDDIWHPDKLKTQIDFMQKNNYAFTFTSYSLIYENGNEMHKIISAISSIRYEEYLKQTIIGCSTVIINRDVVGNFTMPKLVRAEDMGLWVNIMKRGFLAYGLHKCLTKYRVRSEALSSNKIKQFQSIWVVYRQLEGFSIIKSVYYSCFYAINAIKKRYFNRCKLSLQ
jgi:teichuronic acid biosynthesis glycosyltransferase TuaG